MNDFKFFLKKINKLKAADPQTNETKVLKPKVLDNVGDLFNELYYIYKDKYNEEKDGLTAKNKKLLHYKKLRLTDDYQYESEEEKKEQQTSERLNKKEPLKKSTKYNWITFNEWVNEKEAGINSEVFPEHFRYQRPSDMLEDLYKINNNKKSNDLVNVIKSGLNDLKKEIENMGEEEKEIEKTSEIIDIVEKFRYC